MGSDGKCPEVTKQKYRRNTADVDMNLNTAFEEYGISQNSNCDYYEGWGMNIFEGQYYNSEHYTNEDNNLDPNSATNNMFKLNYSRESGSGAILADGMSVGCQAVAEVATNPEMLFEDYSYDPSQENEDIQEEI
ncbi:hypothetical protein BCR33DRAFT_784153 [Rhizoclosmatium globosum]|uniref:Uncharacterized protein n=1 Tax=Rhizoclosmatium globosum TaxID=329046 RepID=A0A1Y2CGA5_9FUNG|nr:hypothetical protein BCR33DRAFT_784153 [Rhizoclosmatium globosum]|eukprot:ORY46042.1 hypothetical protein BCR33DRAFT_784153 [Rhizoclosmatium globosum]